MKRFLRWVGFGRRERRRWLELAAVCPRLFDVSEVRAALIGQKDDPKIQALLQLVTMVRAGCLEAAQDEAQRNGQGTHYQMGGVAACEDLMAEIMGLMEGGTVSDEVRLYFQGGSSGDFRDSGDSGTG